MCVACLVHVFDITPWCVSNDLLMCVTWSVWPHDHMNVSCHTWMILVTYTWVMPQCHMWMSHVASARIWMLSHMHESCHVWISHVTHESVLSHTNESCRIRMSNIASALIWMLSHKNESCHIRMSHVTNESVMSRMNESFHIRTSHVAYGWVISHVHSRNSCYQIIPPWTSVIQSGIDYRSCLAKQALIIGLFCGKWPMNIRHLMILHHSVWLIMSVIQSGVES